MSSLPYPVLFYVFTGIDLSGNRLPLVKEVSCETAAFPYFQVQPAVRLRSNSRKSPVGIYKHHIDLASHKLTALQVPTETQTALIDPFPKDCCLGQTHFIL